MKAAINEQGILITKSIQKYLDIIERGNIEEREIISMKSLMGKNRDAANVLNSAVANNPLRLSKAQEEKGITFLLDQWKTGRGVERKNNPFGYREQEVLENFSHFELAGFWNAGNQHVTFYLPLYNCIAKDGSAFQYYYNGKVNIVG
jgi:hypothetical protein